MILQELHDKYFELYSDLYRAQPYLPAKQYEVMSKSLHDDYMIELERVVGEKQLDIGKQVFELRFRLKLYLPRRGFLWRWNKIAKAYIKRLRSDFEDELAKLYAGIEQNQEEGQPEQEETTALMTDE